MCIWNNDDGRAPGFRQILAVKNQTSDYVDEQGVCWIPPGEFVMGSPTSESGRNRNETPHPVKFTRGFWMLEKPVTQRFFHSILPRVMVPSDGDHLEHNCPVWGIGYAKAVWFCEELTKCLPPGVKADLPTEAQWEYACRAGTTTAYNFGDEFDAKRACCGNDSQYPNQPRLQRPCQTKLYPPNAWGLYDMHGLVWERCRDVYYKYPEGAVVDPQGYAPQDWRAVIDQKIFIIRGGSFHFTPPYARSANRGVSFLADAHGDIGFRVVISSEN